MRMRGRQGLKSNRERAAMGGLASGLLCALAAAGVFAAAPVLTWNPSGAPVWDLATQNWRDAGGAPAVWAQGAVARFDGAGGAVDVQTGVTAGGVTFASGGYTLEGAVLTLGALARIDVLGGSHTVRNTLGGVGPLSVAVQSGRLSVDGQGKVLPQVLLEQGGGALALAGESAGGVSVASGATLLVNGAGATVGVGLSGAPGGVLEIKVE